MMGNDNVPDRLYELTKLLPNCMYMNKQLLFTQPTLSVLGTFEWKWLSQSVQKRSGQSNNNLSDTTMITGFTSSGLPLTAQPVFRLRFFAGAPRGHGTHCRERLTS